MELALIKKWANIMGPRYEIIVAHMSKLKPNGILGISIKETVNRNNRGKRIYHHYIRSVFPDGPVGQNGCIQSGDELLEVNGKKLRGLYFTNVVSILFFLLSQNLTKK